jgi:lipopolysaccharide/colanic/teichoic acid biosynthesis glycosyltransferase
MLINSHLPRIALLVTLDMLSLGASFYVAFLIRFRSGIESIGGLSGSDSASYIQLGAAITLLAPLLFTASGMYKSINLFFGLTEYVLALKAAALLVLVIVFTSFVVGAEPIVSRTWIAIWVLVCVLFLITTRFIARRIITYLRRNGSMQESVLLVGGDAQGAAIAQQLSNIPGVKVVGFLDEYLPVGTTINDKFTILGSTRQIDSLAARYNVDTVLMMPSAISWESRQLLMLSALKPAESTAWKLHIAPGIYEMANLGAELGRVGNIPVLRLHDSSIVGLDAILKRMLDTAIALSLLAILGIPSILMALFLQFRGRKILTRRSVSGLNGKPFNLRSLNLRDGSDSFPEGFERLPMLFHVLKGDMSMIGPRPRAHNEGNLHGHTELLAVRPGVVSVVPRSVMLSSTDEWTRIEATYTRNYSIWTDITLLLRAFVMGMQHLNPLRRSPVRKNLASSDPPTDASEI